MRWKVHGRRTMYESDWVNVHLDDVELPDGTHIDHHVIDFPKKSAGAVVLNNEKQILLLWRHRYITDSWGWEVPAGWIEPGEDPTIAIRREIEEETGHVVDEVEELCNYFPLAGISPQIYYTFIARNGSLVRTIDDSEETDKVEWLSATKIRSLISEGLVSDGPSLLILSVYLALNLAEA